MKKYWDGILRIPEARKGRFAVRHVHYPPGAVFDTANPRCEIVGGQRNHRLQIPYATHWHDLVEYVGADDERPSVWMSDRPCEQAQHDALLRGCRGNVLVGGLGLGYAATVLARKKNVGGVTVVERSQAVIDLVWPHLDLRGKGEVIRADLFKYIRGAASECLFNDAFYDIWRSDSEGTFFDVVVPLRRLSNAAVVHEPRCWNENVMRGQLAFALIFDVVRREHPETKDVPSTLTPPEVLAKPTGDKWHDWRCEFYAALAQGIPNAQRAAGVYAGLYGLRSWKARWEAWLQSERRSP